MTSLANPTGSIRHASGRPAATSFLGRTDELATLEALIEDTPLVTLTGPPGIGKSRLAKELTARLPDGDRDTALVELASLHDGAQLADCVASALSIEEAPGVGLTDTIAAALAERRLLLVLDNCEHLRGDCAQLVDALLSACPRLRVLATSTQPLQLPQERAWHVPPLPVPDPSSGEPAEQLASNPSVRLFVERAAAVEPGFSLNEHVEPAVLEICRRLDGVPLAIELAAARVELLTPAEIARRLDDRFDLLSAGGASDSRRHRTLAAALDWSYELLSAAERALLRRLSVFSGSFDHPAAASICAGGEVDPTMVPPLIEQLVAKSFVACEVVGGRHRLLQTIRAYGTERLAEAGEGRALREAHARFFMELAERAEPQLMGPTQGRWLDRLDAEEANLRAALDWSLGHGRGEWALRQAGSLIWFWRMRARFSEGRNLVHAALSASNGAPQEVKAKALWGAGLLTLLTGEVEQATGLLEDSKERFHEIGDIRGHARALLLLANANQSRDRASVLPLARESAELAREAGDAWCLGLALSVAGHEHIQRSEFSAAQPLLEECVEVARQAGESEGLKRGLLFLGQVFLFQGDHGRAKPTLEQALEIAERMGDDYGRGTTLQYLGSIAWARGDLPRARELFDGAIRLLRATRPADLLVALTARASVARLEDELELARALLEEALSLATRSGDDPTPALLDMGDLALAEGNVPTARRHLEEALDLSRSRGIELHAAEALRRLARLADSEGDVEGAAIAFGEAIDLYRECGNVHGIVVTLETLASTAATSGCPERAVRLLGAADALREARHLDRVGAEAARHESELARLRAELSPQEFDAAWAGGAQLSIDEAVGEAKRRRSRRGRPAAGVESLTEAEQKVARLVARGMSNKRIAEHLFISPGTVKNHLSSIFAKLGVSRRSQLAEEIWRQTS